MNEQLLQRARGVNNGVREQIKTLYFKWGFTPKQISVNFDMPVSTVHVHIHALRKIMQAKYYDNENQ